MELSELVDYALKKYHLREEHKWNELPDYSALINPATEQWIALLIRTPRNSKEKRPECCDLKCGQEVLNEHVPYVSKPFRMRGERWVGITFGATTDRDAVFRLLDQAMLTDERSGYPITLDRKRPKRRATRTYLDTPISGAGVRQETADMSQSGSQPSRNMTVTYDLDLEPKGTGAESYYPGSGEWGTSDAGDKAYAATPIPDAGTQRGGVASRSGLDRIWKMKRMTGPYGKSVTSQESFFVRQGEYMADYEVTMEGPPVQVYGFERTYQHLSTSQLYAYFFWRTQVRKGIYNQTNNVFPRLYQFELINQIGVSSPEQALERLIQFQKGYASYPDKERQQLNRWILDFAVLHGISPEMVYPHMDPAIREHDDMIAVLKDSDAQTDDAVYNALLFFGSKILQKSSVMKKAPEKGKHLFAELWRTGDRMRRENNQDTLFTVCFGHLKTAPKKMMFGAVYLEQTIEKDTCYVLNPCRSYTYDGTQWWESSYDTAYFEKDVFQGILREMERRLREYLPIRANTLQVDPFLQWTEPYINAVLEADRAAEAKAEAEKRRITFDFAGLDRIRRDADRTRDSLLTEDEMDDMPAHAASSAGQTDEAPANGQQTAETTNGAEAETLLCQTDDNSLAGPAQVSAETMGAEIGLDAVQLAVLRALLRDEPTAALLQTHHVMPSIVADGINEALFDEIGDNVLECDGNGIVLVEDYREELVRLLGE